MYLLNVALLGPAQLLSGWIGSTFGTIGDLAFLILLPVALYCGKRFFDRRDERRCYAADRTTSPR